MNVMDGGYGLVASLRGYIDWRQQSDSKKRVIMEMAPAEAVTPWYAYDATGTTYMAVPQHGFFDGSFMPITTVHSGDDPRPLVRVESLADCVATKGSFFYQVYAGPAAPWDDGHTWDSGVLWDAGSAILYVNLWSGLSPNYYTVSARYLLVASSEGGRVPDLGPEKLLNPDFEASANGTSPDSWTMQTAGGGATAGWDNTFAAKGGASFKATSGGGAGQEGRALQSVTLVPGMTYAIMCYYSTGGSVPSQQTYQPYFYVTDGAGNYVNVDGVGTSNSTNWILLGSTAPGEWRVGYFEFTFWGNSEVTGTLALAGRGPAASINGAAVWFDSVSFKAVWARVYAAPRISATALPKSSMSTRDVFFGGKTISSYSATLVNRDLYYASIADSLDWVGQEVRCFLGGGFVNGDIIPRQDYSQEFSGYVDEEHSSVAGFVLSTKDSREKQNIQVPPKVYDSNVYTNLGPNVAGTVRPLLFGTVLRINPARISIDPTTGYGTYDLCDITQSPRGIAAAGTAYAYVDAASAAADDSTKRVQLSVLNGFSSLSATDNAKMVIQTDVQVYLIVAGQNDVLDFSDGATKAVQIAPGPYCQGSFGTDWATTCANALNSISAGFTITYDNVAHKYTVTKASGTFQILLGSGTNRQRTAWRNLGFTGTADLTGALSYTSDTAVFAQATDADKKHFLRFDATGYEDDANGTYTGTPFAAIQLGPDIVRYLLTVFLNRPDIIDPYTFATARTAAPQNLGIYINSAMKLRDILDVIENSCGADIVVGGDGMVTFVVQDSTVPASTVSVNDADYLLPNGLEMAKISRDIYEAITINYATGLSSAASRTNASVSVSIRFEINGVQAFPTYLTSAADAIARAVAMSALGASPHRLATFTVKGKLAGARIGTKMLLSSTKCPMGSLSSKLFRAISISKDPAANKVDVVAVEV